MGVSRSDLRALSKAESALVLDEEELLARVREALTRARAREVSRDALQRARAHELETLRELRQQAAQASEDDAPTLMHELALRQRLFEREQHATLPRDALPYLAHLRVTEGGKTKDYCLGQQSLLDSDAGVRVVDWRVAPIAQVFYRYAEGDEYEEEFPGRLAEGRVDARRIVVFTAGVLSQIITSSVSLRRGDDGNWVAESREGLALTSGGAGHAARPGALGIGLRGSAEPADITAFLDRTQYEAVVAAAHEPLLVLGSAGSGKTTVALHRLAHIVAREGLALERVSVVVPEEGLSRLTRRLLEPLGVAKAQVERLDVWALRLAERVFAERMPPLCEDAPGVVSSLKRHPALYRALEQRFAHLKPTALRFKRLRRQLAEAFTDRDFLRAVVNAAPHELRQSAVEETVRHCMLQLADPIKAELDSIVDPERKRALDGRDIAAGTPQELAGSIDPEDLPILLCVCAWHGKISLSPLLHLVLDEAEDFSFFELRVLRDLLAEPRSVTLAGDEAQRTHSSFAGWPAAQAVLGVQDARVCRLAVSYRCPEPVAELAHRVIAPLSEHAAPRAARSGVLVGHFHFPEPDQAELFVANALRELLEREPAASAAIIAQEPERATRLFELLRDAPRARLVLDGEFSFEAGLDVTDVDNAKGLEFDYVIVPDADAASYPDTPEARHRLHVAITRAAHQLWLVSGGQRSALVASEPLTATSASRPGHRDHS